MNKFSKEIQADLVRMGKLYGFERGILLLDENEENKARAIVFEIASKTEKGAICRFARLVQRCLDISKTFEDIMNHFNIHALAEISKDMEMLNKLHNTPDDKKVVN